MELKFIKLIVFGFTLMASTCSKEDIEPELSQCNLKNVIITVSNTSGTIWFDSQSQAYAVYKGVEGTYDGQDIGVVCNLPDDFKKEGEKIIFSGKYYENNDFVSQIPG